MTIATAAASLHRRGTHRRLADRDFFQSIGSIFGDGDDGGDDDDDGGSGTGHDGGDKSSICEYPSYPLNACLFSYLAVDGMTATTL